MSKKVLIALSVGLVIFAGLQRKNDTPKIYYVDWLPYGFNGLTVPPLGIFILKEQRGNTNLVLHELVHWKQFQRVGLFRILFDYSKEQITKGYDANKYEIEARFMESDFCKTNYTYCVENGLSNTVHRTNFRNQNPSKV